MRTKEEATNTLAGTAWRWSKDRERRLAAASDASFTAVENDLRVEPLQHAALEFARASGWTPPVGG